MNPILIGVLGRMTPAALAERAMERAPVSTRVGAFVDERNRLWLDDPETGAGDLLVVVMRSSDPDLLAEDIEAEVKRRRIRFSRRVRKHA
ncbi:hypothetical protein MASR1M8_16040 [Thermomonas brevis]